MSNFTENAIKRSFIRLLEKKQLKNITIRDIVDDCGINRSSFYYHFQDIPALLEKIIQEGSDSIIRKNASGSLVECMDGVVKFLSRYQKSVIHVYKAVDREVFIQWTERACSYFVSSYLDRALPEGEITERTKHRITQYYLYLVTGFMLRWIDAGLDEGMPAEFIELLEKTCGVRELVTRFSS